MSYQATVLADSISPEGVRLTTLWVTFPRFILAEVNTHRMLSRNSNSSRAIPPERQIEAVRTNPFVPETFNTRVKGMGVGEALGSADQRYAEDLWHRAAANACSAAEQLLALDVDKSRINRLLEPFLWHSAVITATEWSNFFALRDSPQAQPEFQITARLMREAMAESVPREVLEGQWHLPGLTTNERVDVYGQRRWDEGKRVSAGRLARWTSYGHEGDYEPVQDAIVRCDRLISSLHLSPLEHQARPMTVEDIEGENALDVMVGMGTGDAREIGQHFVGNLRGWVQFRKEIPREHDASLTQETVA